MFNSLYKLYRSNSKKTPLEDYNTECFKGILEFYPDILKSFIEFLKLPEGNYNVKTQEKHHLPNYPNCIVDMVLESETNICFIENKVNSKEGWEQLTRYSLVLDGIKQIDPTKKTYLKYCTKRVDLKKNIKHNFTQFRWFHIGKWLEKNHKSNVMANNYLIFLKEQQMAMDTSISTNTAITLKHFLKTYESMDFHIKEAIAPFKKQFPNAKIEKQEKISKLREHDRVARLIVKPLKDKSFNSEILYCIHFELVKLQTQIWVHKNHPKCEEIAKRGKASGLFESSEIDQFGLSLRNSKKLFHFIDRENSDQEIRQWFEDSFIKMRTFIDNNKDLNWDLKF